MVRKYKTLRRIVDRFRDELTNGGNDFLLLYAFNGTGKTRLSMEFKERGKRNSNRDTLYFNAFTEDLFSWDNDLSTDTQRVLRLNQDSQFFSGLQELEMESRIGPMLERYADFSFFIDYENWTVQFTRQVAVGNTTQTAEYIKISRGEENLFIWCFFLAVAQLAIDEQEAYSWVKYIYVDDPISSLDDNNAIAVACDLANLLTREGNTIKTIISSHHSLFFNVICNELKNRKRIHCRYFLHNKVSDGYRLQSTDDTPFFHHVALLSELKQAADTDNINTYHFNTLRSILEKTSSFFGYNDFGRCIHGLEDELLFNRALNLLSHGAYSIFNPVPMVGDNKALFKNILQAFLDKYQFDLPAIFAPGNTTPNPQ